MQQRPQGFLFTPALPADAIEQLLAVPYPFAAARPKHPRVAQGPQD